MISINYEFKALSPIHTGSDEDLGTMKSLRRQKVILDKPIEIESCFAEEERIDAIVKILLAIYMSIDFSKMSNERIKRIWDEFYSKLLKAATTSNKYAFFDVLCKGFDIRSVQNEKIVDIIDKLNSEELLETVRSKANYLILKVRREKNRKGNEIFEPKKEKVKFVKNFEMIPCISGNSIRGIMRRLAMHDFVKRVGITKLNKDMYHILFTGGVLDDATLYEDIEKREKLIEMCPMIGVFGAAIGNMTIEGNLAVGFAYPKCKELGTGEKSYWEYLDVIFQTRRDDSKTEKELEIVGEQSAVTQMKYEYEVFSPGTIFNHGFRMYDVNEMLVSAFWHCLKLFKEYSCLGGLSAVGNGLIDLSLLHIPENAENIYVDYIEKNKEDIKNFIENV